MDGYTTLQLGATQIWAGLLSVILAFFRGYLEANKPELENYLRLEFLETENSTVQTCFSGDYSYFY